MNTETGTKLDEQSAVRALTEATALRDFCELPSSEWIEGTPLNDGEAGAALLERIWHEAWQACDATWQEPEYPYPTKPDGGREAALIRWMQREELFGNKADSNQVEAFRAGWRAATGPNLMSNQP
jgi:hypothetical protein